LLFSSFLIKEFNLQYHISECDIILLSVATGN